MATAPPLPRSPLCRLAPFELRPSPCCCPVTISPPRPHSLSLSWHTRISPSRPPSPLEPTVSLRPSKTAWRAPQRDHKVVGTLFPLSIDLCAALIHAQCVQEAAVCRQSSPRSPRLRFCSGEFAQSLCTPPCLPRRKPWSLALEPQTPATHGHGATVVAPCSGRRRQPLLPRLICTVGSRINGRD